METGEKEKVTKVGFAAKDAKFTKLDDGKTVANLTIISGTGDNKIVTSIRGWNAMAELMANIKTGEKWEFKGSMKDEPGKDDKVYPTLTAKEAYPHVKLSIENAEIRFIEDKKIRDTPMRNIMIVKNEIKGGKEVGSVFNIELYGARNIVKSEGFEKGNLISITGHARHYPYQSKEGEKKMNIAFQNPLEIKNHSLEAKAAKSQKIETQAEVAPQQKETKKSKGKGIGI
jgi:single-stranded DNA-binding protein